MTDRGDPDRLSFVGHLVEDPVDADPQRIKAAKPSSERVARKRIALQQAERVLDRVDQRPSQTQQVAAGPPGEDEPCQRSVGGRTGGGQLLRSSASVTVSPRSISPRPSSSAAIAAGSDKISAVSSSASYSSIGTSAAAGTPLRVTST